MAGNFFAQAQEHTNVQVEIYSDELDNGWRNWSWAEVNLTNSAPVHSGSDSIAVTARSGEALWFHCVEVPMGGRGVSLWINGGSAGGQLLAMQATSGTNDEVMGAAVNLDPLPENVWRQVTLSFGEFNVAGDAGFNGFWIQNRSGTAQATFYVDDVELEVAESSKSAPVRPPAISLTKGLFESIYSDGLGNGWENWSWAAVVLANESQVRSGSTSIEVTAGPWEALFLYNHAVPAEGWTDLIFGVNGGAAGGQLLQIQAFCGTSAIGLATGLNLDPLPTNAWRQVTVPLVALGVTNAAAFNGFWIKDRTGTTQPTFYVNDVALLKPGALQSSTNRW